MVSYRDWAAVDGAQPTECRAEKAGKFDGGERDLASIDKVFGLRQDPSPASLDRSAGRSIER